MATHNINNHHFKDYDALQWAKEWIRDEFTNKTSTDLQNKIDSDVEVWFKPEKVKEAVARSKFEGLVTEALAIPPSDSHTWAEWIEQQGAIMEPMSRADFDAWIDHLRSKEIILASKPGGPPKSGTETGKSEPVDFTVQKAEIVESPDNVFQVHNGKNRVWCLTEIDHINVEFTGHTPTTDDVSGNVMASTTAMGIELNVKFNSALEERQALEKLVKDRVEGMMHKLLDEAIGRWSYIVNENVNKGKKSTVDGTSTPELEKPVRRASRPADTSKAQIGASRTLVSTTTLTETVGIMTDSEHLFRAFTDAEELSRIVHGPCKIEGALPGAKFEMLDGAILGEFLDAEKPKRIVQSWRLRDWPAGHFSRLQLEFKEDGNQTNMVVEWTGVPADQADVTMQNFKRFFIEPLQRLYGRLLI